MTIPKVVTIGDAFLALRAIGFSSLETTHSLECLLAGSEANVVVGLRRLGLETAWIGKLPNTILGRKLANYIRQFDVDLSRVVWTDSGRVGLAFVELGVPPRPNIMIYDRENCVSGSTQPGEIDWDFIKSAQLLHLTGIFSSLSDSCHKTAIKAVSEMHKAGGSVSVDVNYRSTMWAIEDAKPKISELIQGVEILFVGLSEAVRLFEVIGEPASIAEQLQVRFKNKVVIIKQGDKGCSVAGDKIYEKPAYHVTVLNRFGAGDAFTAGFLYGYLDNSLEKAIDFGTAMAAYKLSVPDLNAPIVTLQDIENIIENEKGIVDKAQIQIRSREVQR